MENRKTILPFTLILAVAVLFLTPVGFSQADVDNVTVQIDGLGGEIVKSTEDTPYIISENGDMTRGIVSYGNFENMENTSNSINMTHRGGGFLIPFYNGTRDDIESRQELLQEREFLDTVHPSFSFQTGFTPTVRVSLNTDVKLTGFDETFTSSFDLRARNEGLENGDPSASLTPQ